MISSLSRYHFFCNIILVVICVLQLAVTKEQNNDTPKEEEHKEKKPSKKRDRLKTILGTSVSYLTSHSLRKSWHKEDLIKDDDNHDDEEKEEDNMIDKALRFITIHINKITSVLILILSSTYISLISGVYFLYILYFVYFCSFCCH